MKNIINNNSMIAKTWLMVSLSIMFIITLPIMIVLLPFFFAYEIANSILKKKDKKRKPSSNLSSFTLFGDDGLFGFNNWEKK